MASTYSVALRRSFIRTSLPWVAIFVSLMQSGCLSPWGLFRKNDANMEQMIRSADAQDADAKTNNANANGNGNGNGNNPNTQRRGLFSNWANPFSPRDTNGSARGVDTDPNIAGSSKPAAGSTASSAKSGSNPNSAQAKPNQDKSAPADESLMSEEELQAAYAAAPPHLRPLLKRQWEATLARREQKSEAPQGDKANSTRNPAAQTESKSASFRLSDSDEPEAGGKEYPGSLVANSASPSPSTAQSANDNAASSNASASATNLADNSANKGSLEELAPPPGKASGKAPSQSLAAHAEPLDTGIPMDPALQSAGRADRNVQMAAATKAGSANSDGYVAPAHADTSTKSQPATPASAVASSSTSASANPTSSSSEDRSWRDHLREALRLLEEEVEAEKSTASPTVLMNAQATARMLHLSLGELEPALKPIDGLQPHEQEFFRHEFQALHDAIDPQANPVMSRRWTLAIDSHRKALTHLAAVSNLEIKNAAFCTSVESYGVIERFASAHFRPSQELLLYCELDNFQAEQVKDGFETQLQGSYEIVDAGGRRVAELLLPVDSDVCRHQRRDYFIAYRIYMPQQIATGRYQLRLTIEDMKGRKFGQTNLDFQIVP